MPVFPICVSALSSNCGFPIPGPVAHISLCNLETQKRPGARSMLSSHRMKEQEEEEKEERVREEEGQGKAGERDAEVRHEHKLDK